MKRKEIVEVENFQCASILIGDVKSFGGEDIAKGQLDVSGTFLLCSPVMLTSDSSLKEGRNIFLPLIWEPKPAGSFVDMQEHECHVLVTGFGFGNLPKTLTANQGVAILDSPGLQGYFEVFIRNSAQRPYDDWSQFSIGLSTQLLDSANPLGFGQCDFGWGQLGEVVGELVTVDEEFSTILKYKSGDRIGILIDCTSNPLVHFFINGKDSHKTLINKSGYGHVVVPAICLRRCEISIPSNPSDPF